MIINDFKLTFFEISIFVVNKTFQLYDFVTTINRVWSIDFFQTIFTIYNIIESFLRSVRLSRLLKSQRANRTNFNQLINWLFEWAKHFDFFITAVRHFYNVINQYRINEFYQTYVRIFSSSLNNFHFIDETSFKIELNNIDNNAFRSQRVRNLLFEKLNNVVIFFFNSHSSRVSNFSLLFDQFFFRFSLKSFFSHHR